MDADELAADATPTAAAAVAAYGFGSLTRDPDPRGEPSREVGCGILQAIHWRTKEAPQLEGAVSDLARRPEDPDAVAALRLQIAKALEADGELLRQVGALVAGGVDALADGTGDRDDGGEGPAGDGAG